jgi:hypothetical protein
MNEKQHPPGEADGDGQAQHGYRNEVSWDAGRGRQPYTNRGETDADIEQRPDAAGEYEGGNAGEISGNNVEQLRAVKQKPGRTESEGPRGTDSAR